MAGIYIHIPFCKQACYYCNFHFSTLPALKSEMTEAIKKELLIRKNFLSGDGINTIYFGGGTPSLIPTADIADILKDINQYFSIEDDPEITLEVNPDDLSFEKARELNTLGINRLSIGIQSFNDDTLKYLHRAHDSATALQCVETARKSGFTNINIDLIFGIKRGYLPFLKKDLSILRKLSVEHVSTYCLTIEPRTVFGNWLKKGRIHQATDDEAAAEFEYIMDDMLQAGYDHYEISNFSLEGVHSKHNTSYWRNVKYLGIGPSAHSFDLENRYSNVSNNSIYIKSLSQGKVPETIDYLTENDRINEYIMTSLRTKWGCDLNYINSKFGRNLPSDSLSYIQKLGNDGFLTENGNLIQLTKKGKLIADRIASDLFVG